MDRRKSRIVLVIVAALAAIALIYKDVLFRPRPPAEAAVNQKMPNARLRDFEGKETDFSKIQADIRKEDPAAKILVVMWATWCEPCVHEMPLIEKQLVRLQSEHTHLVLINYDGGDMNKAMPEVKAWLITQKLGFKTYFDFNEGPTLLESLKADALPFTIAISESGRIKWVRLGELDWKKSKISVD